MSTLTRVYATPAQNEQVARVLRARGHVGSTKEYFSKLNYQIKGVNYRYWEVDKLLGVQSPRQQAQPTVINSEFEAKYFQLVADIGACANISQVRKVLAQLN